MITTGTTSPPTHFFSFPSGKSADQQYRRKAWIEFCKRKAFQPSSCTRICSLHFAEDAYEPGNSPQFLERLQFKEKFLVRLKKDALPTLNKALENPSTTTSGKTRDSTVRRQRIIGGGIQLHLVSHIVRWKSAKIVSEAESQSIWKAYT